MMNKYSKSNFEEKNTHSQSFPDYTLPEGLQTLSKRET